MPDRVLRSKPDETELYEVIGGRIMPSYLYGALLMCSFVLFFFLTRSIQGNRQTLLIWIVSAFLLTGFIMRRFSQNIEYSITDQQVRARNVNTHGILWAIDTAEITHSRLLPGKVSISIPKKTYLVYTGTDSIVFLSHLREAQSRTSRLP